MKKNKLSEMIQSVYQNTSYVIYRFDEELQQLLWYSAVLPANIDKKNIKIIRRIHIPMSSKGIFNDTLLAGVPKNINYNSELTGVYELEFRRWVQVTNTESVTLVPLIIENKIQGLIIIFNKDVANVNLITKDVSKWTTYIERINQQASALKIQAKNKSKTNISNPKIPESSALTYLDLGDILCKDENNQAKQILQCLVKIENIFKLNIEQQNCKLVSRVSWRMVAISPSMGHNPVNLTLATIHIRDQLLALQETMNCTFQFRIGLGSGVVYSNRKMHKYRIWGKPLAFLDRLTRTCPNGSIQISEPYYKKIASKFDCSLRGKLKFSKNGPERKLIIIKKLKHT